MIDLKKISKAFGLSVTAFAEKIGYTRPGLYNAVAGNCSSCRMYAALKFLKQDSDLTYQADVEKAQNAREKREQAIKDLAKACKVVSPIGEKL